MKKGFTLIELVMVIVIISILAAIAIPKFVDLQSNAKQAACDGNIATIRSSIAAYYAKTAVAGDALFPGSLTQNTFKHNYFASEALPACPYSIDYVYSSATGVVASHSHGD
ncbi:MAG: prepilin-type N-terminal cleavage/methylation domain-containing protein [Candidatus Saelkia tenebricola]|nr:prepilin-type N-terminal cleavage/methylation domain-containing protein [Candidatus Saelkia tenebricola]